MVLLLDIWPRQILLFIYTTALTALLIYRLLETIHGGLKIIECYIMNDTSAKYISFFAAVLVYVLILTTKVRALTRK